MSSNESIDLASVLGEFTNILGKHNYVIELKEQTETLAEAFRETLESMPDPTQQEINAEKRKYHEKAEQYRAKMLERMNRDLVEEAGPAIDAWIRRHGMPDKWPSPVLLTFEHAFPWEESYTRTRRAFPLAYFGCNPQRKCAELSSNCRWYPSAAYRLARLSDSDRTRLEAAKTILNNEQTAKNTSVRAEQSAQQFRQFLDTPYAAQNITAAYNDHQRTKKDTAWANVMAGNFFLFPCLTVAARLLIPRTVYRLTELMLGTEGWPMQVKTAWLLSLAVAFLACIVNTASRLRPHRRVKRSAAGFLKKKKRVCAEYMQVLQAQADAAAEEADIYSSGSAVGNARSQIKDIDHRYAEESAALQREADNEMSEKRAFAKKWQDAWFDAISSNCPMWIDDIHISIR